MAQREKSPSPSYTAQQRRCPNCLEQLPRQHHAGDHRIGCVVGAIAEVLVTRGHSAATVNTRIGALGADRFEFEWSSRIGPAIDAFEEALGL
jgi:hypothetical protein